MSAIQLLNRPIAFHRAYVDLGIGITGALMLSQCVYWHTRTKDADGWFYKSQTDWELETGMSRREQETARKRLEAAGFLEEQRKGVPARLFFRVNVDALESALNALSASMAESANQECTGGASSMAKSANQDCTKPPGSDGGTSQSITEITSETTPEITAEETSGPDRPDSPAAACTPDEEIDAPEPHRPGAAIEDGKFWGTQRDLDLANWMWHSLVDQLGRDRPRTPNFARWANTIRLTRERDGREHRHIKALFGWCRSHRFWAANCQSPESLREKWSQLAMQRKEERTALTRASTKASQVEDHNREVGRRWAGARPPVTNDGRVYDHE